MAEFDESIEIVLEHEGGYANDPRDSGGETYRGISRRWHPDCPIWGIIDQTIASLNLSPPLSKEDIRRLDALLSANKALVDMVHYFYKKEFWDRIHGDDISSQGIANNIFDAAVLMNCDKAALLLQRSLNALNRMERDYPNLKTDGMIGSLTIEVLDKYLDIDDEILLLTVFKGLRIARLAEIMEKDESKEIFARSWLNRVNIEVV